MLDAPGGDPDHKNAFIFQSIDNKQKDGSSLDGDLRTPAQILSTVKDISNVLRKQGIGKCHTMESKEKHHLSQSTSQTTSGPTTPTCENSEDDVVDPSSQDVHLPCLDVNDDLLKARNGQLMMMLNEITAEFPEDDTVSAVPFSSAPSQTQPPKIPMEDDLMSAVTFSAAPPHTQQERMPIEDDAMSAITFSVAPSQTQQKNVPIEDDAMSAVTFSVASHRTQQEMFPVQALLQECNVMWEEVQTEAVQKRELHTRLLAELKQMQERSERQHHETSSLMQRLMGAKQMLREKLQEASVAKQDLCDRIKDECRGNECLQIAISESEQVMLADAKRLNRQLSEVSEEHASLRGEVQAATESQAALEFELQNEKIATRQHCTDLVKALARGNPLPANLAAFEPSQQPTQSGQEMGDSRCATLHGQASTDSEEQVRLQRQCCFEAQRIKELREELSLEEAVRSQYLVQLEDAAALITSSGLQLHRSCDTKTRMPPASICTEGDVGIDVASHVRDAVNFAQELEGSEVQCRRAAEKESKAQDIHHMQEEKLSALQARVLQGQFECEDRAREIVESNENQERLCSEIEVERAEYKQERHVARERLQLARSQVQKKKAELVHWKEANRRLTLELQRKRGCFFPRRKSSTSQCSTTTRGKGTPRKHTPSRGVGRFADTIGRPTSASHWLNG